MTKPDPCNISTSIYIDMPELETEIFVTFAQSSGLSADHPGMPKNILAIIKNNIQP